MNMTLSFFGAPLTRYGLSVTLSLMLTLAAALVWCARRRVPFSGFIRMALLSAPLAWLCGRVAFVLVNFNYYWVEIENPSLALCFWDGGYSIMGAYLGLVLAALIAERWTHQPRGTLLDALGIGLAPGLLAARLAERGTGIGEGAPVPEGWPAFFSIDTEYGLLHTVFLYEAIAAAVICLALLLWQRMDTTRRRGDVLLMFTLLFGCSQVVLESLREDGHMTVHMGVSVQQVIAAVMVVTVLAIWLCRAVRAGAVKPWQAALSAAEALAAVILAVVAEFGVDRWDSKLLAYGLMLACVIDLFVLSDICRRLAAKAKP